MVLRTVGPSPEPEPVLAALTPTPAPFLAVPLQPVALGGREHPGAPRFGSPCPGPGRLRESWALARPATCKR